MSTPSMVGAPASSSSTIDVSSSSASLLMYPFAATSTLARPSLLQPPNSVNPHYTKPQSNITTAAATANKSLMTTNKLLTSVYNFEDANWSHVGFRNMEEIRRMGKVLEANNFQRNKHLKIF